MDRDNIPIPRARNGKEVDKNLFNQVVSEWHSGKITAREAYKRLNIAERTFYLYIEQTGLIKTKKRFRNAKIPEELYNRLKEAGEI